MATDEIRIGGASGSGASRLHATAKITGLSDKPAAALRSRRGRPREFSEGELAAVSMAYPGVTSERHRRRLALALRGLASLVGVPGVEALTNAETLPLATLTALGSVIEADRIVVSLAVCSRSPATDVEGVRLTKYFAMVAKRVDAEGRS